MLTDTPSIHHVTSLVEQAQRNVDFYVGVLGLRLVKRTVNQEDMLRYHLFYGPVGSRRYAGAGDMRVTWWRRRRQAHK